VTKAAVQPITISGEALGTTRAQESLDITANITETIAAIRFEEGQRVQQGDVLVVFTKAEEEAQKDAIEAQLADHRREIKRLRRLVKQGAAPQTQLDARLTQLHRAQAEKREIEAKIQDRIIKAPFNGVVGIRHFSVGALVRPTEVITTLDAIETIKLDLNVPATYLPQLAIGLPLIAQSEVFSDRTFNGKITHIDTRVDPQTRSIKVLANLPNPDLRLKPGLFMHVKIITDRKQGILIPEIAVVFREDKQYLYLVTDENVVESRPVSLGTRIDGQVEILNGIEPGDRVITEGIVKVSPGQKVRILNPPASKASAQPAQPS
jgi:membrane fusion protein (multidrug efflux system)